MRTQLAWQELRAEVSYNQVRFQQDRYQRQATREEYVLARHSIDPPGLLILRRILDRQFSLSFPRRR